MIIYFKNMLSTEQTETNFRQQYKTLPQVDLPEIDIKYIDNSNVLKLNNK